MMQKKRTSKGFSFLFLCRNRGRAIFPSHPLKPQGYFESLKTIALYKFAKTLKRMTTGIINFIQKKVKVYKDRNSLLGSWGLDEFYTDQGGQLLHVDQQKLKSENHLWELSFFEKGRLKHSSNLGIQGLQDIGFRQWKRERNYVALMADNPLKVCIRYQFAIDKGILKLLKKEKNGAIVIFAFFKKKEAPMVEAPLN